MKNKYDKLQSYRVRFGFTQEDFGALIGCNGSNYSSKENGNVNWFIKECITLKNVINKKLREIDEPELTLEDLFPERILFAHEVSNKTRKKKVKSSA